MGENREIRNSLGELHCEDGPAIEWKDGTLISTVYAKKVDILEFHWEVGKIYVLRNGLKMQCTEINTDPFAPFPIKGKILFPGGGEEPSTWTRKGRYSIEPHDRDVFDSNKSPSFKEKVELLLSMGLRISVRDPEMCWEHDGKFGVFHPQVNMPCRDASEAREFAIVGDDLEKLVNEAFAYFMNE